jgi:hypothetical protein
LMTRGDLHIGDRCPKAAGHTGYCQTHLHYN